MILLEQFVYTAAETTTRMGYQVIARSGGVSDEIVSQLNQYVFPIVIDPSEFKESRSLLILKKGKIAFSRIRNIGIGYDGRRDTFYNHTIVMSESDFKKIDYDTRILENFYFENSKIKGSLPQLKIEPQKIPLNLEIETDIQNVLYDILLALFNKEKIALIDNQNPELIQKILSIIPPSVRLISFSSLVNDVEKQSDYDFIITNRKTHSMSDKKFKIIEIGATKQSTKKEHYEESILLLSDLIKNKETHRVSEIYQDFEKISVPDFKHKIMMLIFFDKLQHSEDKLEKQDSAYVVLDCLKKLEETALTYFNKIKEFLHYEDVQRYAPELEIRQILIDSAELPLERNGLENWLGKLSDGTSESRLKLLHELFAKRQQDFFEQGSKLLIDCRYSMYRPEIYRFFIETKELHACIFKTLEDKDLENIYKQNILESIFIQSTKYNPQILSKLLDYDVYDLEDIFGTKNFHHSLQGIFKTKEFYNANFNIISTLLEKLFSKVKQTLFRERKSGIMELPNSVIKEHVKIVKMLHRFTENYPSEKLSESQKQKLNSLNNEFLDFINKNDVDDPVNFWNPFSYFR